MKEPMIDLGNGRIEMNLSSLTLTNITIARLRDAILSNYIFSGPGVIEEFMPDQNQLDTISDACKHAVTFGQVIDFGFWPNDMIKNTSKRAGPLYNQHALGQPFGSSWIFLHSWDSEIKSPLIETKGPVCTAYLVNPFSDELGCGFEALELCGYTIQGRFMLGVGDRVLFNPDWGSEQYNVAVIPEYKRFPIEEMQRIAKELSTEDTLNDIAAACNVIDPIMTALMILNTRGIKTETVPAPVKLNKVRAKTGKHPIPAYRTVNSVGYVTAWHNRQEQAKAAPGAAGGHHASPIGHIRLGHWRHYQTGTRSWIRDTMVNVSDELRDKFQANRSHYKAPKS